MPQFIMPGFREPSFQGLDNFTQGYCEALFFTEEGEKGEDGIGEAGFYDFAPETLESIKTDCEKFQRENESTLAKAYAIGDYDEAQAGRDFWFTRNGHGVGFWDRGLGDVGEALTDLCGFRTNFAEVDAYLGDDGKIYFS